MSPIRQAMRASTLAFAAILALATAGTAATLTGDTVRVRFIPQTLILTSNPIGAGIDLTQFKFQFDFDAGANRDEFVFFDNGGAFGRNNRISLRDLNFSGGHILVGFQLTGGSLRDLRVSSFDRSSVTFRFTDPGSGANNGAAIQGRFLTAAAPIPLPAGLPLLLAGLGAFAALRRKSRATG